jgi:hypothetical protein
MKQYFTAKYWKGQRLLLLTFLLLHVVVASIHISQQSITHDEPDYYTYAARWAQGKVERNNPLYDSKSPVVAVALIPRIIQQLRDPHYEAADNGMRDVKAGRYFMVVFTIIIAVYLFIWIRKLFGAKAWIFPVLFFLFDPTVISFSMIITSDMATGACLIATMYHLFRFYEEKQRNHFLAFTIWLGVSFVCKASLLFLLPCLALMYVLLVATGKLRFRFKPLLVYSGLIVIIALAIINIGYFGKHSCHTLQQMQLSSSMFKSVASNPVLNRIPIPVPENYINALDLLNYHAEIGAGKPESTYPGVFINGQIKQKDGFWYYYIVVGLFKIPIAILLLMIATAVTALLNYRSVISRIGEYIWFLFPTLFFFIVLSFYNPLQLGFRHFLLIYPLLFIGIGGLLKFLQSRLRHIAFVGWLLLSYMLFSVGTYFPNLLAYTNEFIPDKKNVFRIMADASLDYGQNTEATHQYLIDHPGVQVPQATPRPGKYMATARQLYEHYLADQKKSWLLNFEPVAHYKYTIFIFNISEQDITSLQQKSSAK